MPESIIFFFIFSSIMSWLAVAILFICGIVGLFENERIFIGSTALLMVYSSSVMFGFGHVWAPLIILGIFLVYIVIGYLCHLWEYRELEDKAVDDYTRNLGANVDSYKRTYGVKLFDANEHKDFLSVMEEKYKSFFKDYNAAAIIAGWIFFYPVGFVIYGSRKVREFAKPSETKLSKRLKGL